MQKCSWRSSFVRVKLRWSVVTRKCDLQCCNIGGVWATRAAMAQYDKGVQPSQWQPQGVKHHKSHILTLVSRLPGISSELDAEKLQCYIDSITWGHHLVGCINHRDGNIQQYDAISHEAMQ
eukprot:1607394-Amphidinium_carterae.1